MKERAPIVGQEVIPVAGEDERNADQPMENKKRPCFGTGVDDDHRLHSLMTHEPKELPEDPDPPREQADDSSQAEMVEEARRNAGSPDSILTTEFQASGYDVAGHDNLRFGFRGVEQAEQTIGNLDDAAGVGAIVRREQEDFQHRRCRYREARRRAP